jgi:hypothetical protein
MAVTFTVTKTKVYVNGDRKEVIADVACTGTPTAGGDALTAAALGLDIECDVVACSNASLANGTGGLVVSPIHASATPTSVTIVFYTAAGTPATGTALAAYTGATANYSFRVRAVGKGAATA